MKNLLPFAQFVRVIHPYNQFETGFITNAAPSLYNRGWRYAIRSDKRMRSGYFQWGEKWYDEMDLEPTTQGAYQFPRMLNVEQPERWPPKMTRTIGKRLGIYGSNGMNDKTDIMYSMLPGSITCIGDYLGDNKVFWYKEQHPEVSVIVRFYIGPTNFQEDIEHYARTIANRVISKWDEVKPLDPYIYFCNEMNLHYENGDPDAGNQHLYTTQEFYQNYANWIGMTADIIKQAVPEMKLITPPFAYGHQEDGQPDDEGNPKIGWAGYDPLAGTIAKYFDNIITFHGYWKQDNLDQLYHPDLSSWYAFRWRRLLKLFETRYNIKAKVIIDECGNFDAGHPDFFDQLRYYGEECLKCKEVIAVTPFIWDDPTNSPGNVPNSWVHNIPDLPNFAARLAALPDVQETSPSPEPEPTPEPIPDPEPPPEPTPEPPEPPEMTIKMHTETKPQELPIIVGNWLESDAGVELITPYGQRIQTITGSKQEWGENGFEAGYANADEDYLLVIDGNEFTVRGGQFTRVWFEKIGDEPVVMVKLISKPINEKAANEIMTVFPGVFEIV
jgi:hypothetical protein